MRYKVDRGAHAVYSAVYSLHYHLIFVVKYRRKVFTNDRIIDFLKEKIHEISETFEVEVLAIECDIDYVHILFKAKPTLNIPKYINALNTITSREVRENSQKSRRSCGKTSSAHHRTSWQQLDKLLSMS